MVEIMENLLLKNKQILSFDSLQVTANRDLKLEFLIRLSIIN